MVESSTKLPLPGDRYEHEKHLGSGGMGVVNQVFDKLLQRSVAMKLMSLDHAKDPEAVESMLTEARVAGMLEHPNIIPVYDVGQLDDGSPYYTMRLMDSLSMADVLDLLREGNPEVRRKYPMVQLLRIFLSVCLGVDYAHSRGVIHRDLKPENVRLGRFGEVQLADWGLAKVEGMPDLAYEKAIRDASDSDGHLPCIVIGSPNYMSPEQACGLNDELGPTSDIYSLGCMLYEILTLAPPQDDTDTMILLDKVEQEAIIAPSIRAPERIIPPLLEQVCLESLEKDPDLRVQDVRVIIKTIEVFLDGYRLRTENDAHAFDGLQSGQRFSDAYFGLSESRDELTVRLKGEDNPESILGIQQEIEALSLDIAGAWDEAHMAYTRALGFNPDDLIARAKLAELAWHRLLSAEFDGDIVSCQLYWGMLTRYNDGAYDRLLEGNARLLVESKPAGAVIALTNWVEPALDQRDRAGKNMGHAPLEIDDAQSGLYVITASLDGYEKLSLPVFLKPKACRKVIMELQPA
jgi:serine/threonine-protein kinase